MSSVLRLAIVDPDDSARESLKKMLLGMDMVWLEAECSRYAFFADVVAQTTPDVGVVALDKDPDEALRLISLLAANSPDTAILATSSKSDGDLILRTIRAGAKEFLTQPLRIEDAVGALERIGQIRFGHKEGKTRGCKVISVCGATGGVGTTSVAVNLGCELASREGNSAALVDLDLALGDADVFLDTIPDYTLLDVAQNIARLDFALLKKSLTKHSSGLYLLPRPVQLQDVSMISPDDINRVIGLMRASFSHLILDLSKSYSEVDHAALKASDHILSVIQLDLPCLRNVVRLMMSFEEDDQLKERTKILVNRAGLDGGQISLKKAQETIGRQIFWQIPNDYRVMSEVRNNGVPLIEHAPRASVTQSFAGLADALAGRGKESDEEKGVSRWLRLWSGKSKGKEAPATR